MSLFLLLSAGALQERTASFAISETGADTLTANAQALNKVSFSVTETGEDVATINALVSESRTASFTVTETGSDTASAVAYNNPRYWVGGTGTWNTTSTTNWALTSGGASGASVPSSTTSVIFNADSNSATDAFTVTLTNAVSCLDFVVDSPDGVATFASGSTPTLTVAGDFVLQSANVTWSITNQVRFQGTGTHTVTTAGKTMNHSAAFQGTGVYRLEDNWTGASTSSDISHTAGTLDFNGHNVTCADLTSSGTAVRTLNLGSGTVHSNQSISNITWTGSNLTVNPGTSLIRMSGAGSTLALNGFTVYDVEVNAISSNAITISQTFTCRNLDLNNDAAGGTVNTSTLLVPSGTITCTGSLTVTGLDQRRRLFVRLLLVGNGLCTLNAASIGLISDADFCGVIGAGAAAPFTGTRVGNGGNSSSGITFDTPRTVYWRGTAGTSGSADATCPFSLTNGGSTSTAAYPLPQDTVIVNENTLASTVTTGSSNAPLHVTSLDFTNRSTAITWNNQSAGTAFCGVNGSLKLSSAVSSTATSSPSTVIYSTDLFEITSAGVALRNNGFTQRQYNGGSTPLPITRLLDTTTIGTNASLQQLQQESGRLDLNGHDLTLWHYAATNSGQTITKEIELWFGAGRFIVDQRTVSIIQITLTNASNFRMESGKYIELGGGNGTTAVTIQTQSAANGATSFAAHGRSGVASFKLASTLSISALTWNSGAVNNLDMSLYGSSPGFTSNLSAPIYFYGDVTLSPLCTVPSSTTQIQWIGQDGGTQNLNANGASLNAPLRFALGSTDALNLTGNLTLSSSKSWELVSGNFNLGSYTITSAGVDIDGSSVRSLNFGTGVVQTSNGLDANPATNLTLSGASTGTLRLTHSVAADVDMASCASKWPTIELATSAITNFLTSSAQSVYNLKNTVYDTETYLGSHQFTFDLFELSGQASSPQLYESITPFSGSGSVSKASGIVACDYLSITSLPASGGASWYAGANSIDNGGNTGWVFSAPGVTLTGNNVNQAASSTTGAITQVHALTGNSVHQTSTTNTAAITQTHILSGNNVAQTPTSSTGAVDQAQTLTGNNVSQTASSTTGAVIQTHKPAGNSVFQANSSTDGAITQTHQLFGNSVIGTSTVTTGAVSQTHQLFGNSVIGAPTVTSSAISQTHQLAGNSVIGTPTVTSGAISQAHQLFGNSVIGTPTVTSGAISQTHQLAGTSVNQENNSTNGSIGQAGDLIGANVAQRNQSTSGSITQTHQLFGANVFQRSVCTTGAVSSGAITGQNVNQTNTSSTAAITQTHQLAANSVNQPKQTTTGSVSQIHRLSGAASRNDHISSTAAIAQTHGLSGASVSQPNRSTSGAIALTVVLTGANAVAENRSSAGAISIVVSVTGEAVFQRNRANADAIGQVHNLLGLNLNQTAASSAGFVVLEGNLLGQFCTSQSTSTTGAIEAFEVVSAPSGTGYTGVAPNTRRIASPNTKRPARLSTQKRISPQVR